MNVKDAETEFVKDAYALIQKPCATHVCQDGTKRNTLLVAVVTVKEQSTNVRAVVTEYVNGVV